MLTKFAGLPVHPDSIAAGTSGDGLPVTAALAHSPARRRVLFSALASAAFASAAPVMANTGRDLWQPQAQEAFGGRARSVDLSHLHTGERLSLVLFPNELPGRDMFDAFERFMRDHYSGHVGDMDPELLAILFDLQQGLDVAHGQFDIISGFRSKATNARLRRRSTKVARNSYHTRGQAMDLRMRQVRLKDLRNTALDERTGGVGYYRRSGFLHVDTGPVRRW